MSDWYSRNTGYSRCDLLLEQLEERIVLDAAPWDGVWNNLGDGYWFRYDALTNDQFWWYDSFFDVNSWMRFDPEAQQWALTEDSGATWTGIGDAGGWYADVTSPADTFWFDGEQHFIKETEHGDDVYFEFQDDMTALWTLDDEGTLYDFEYDYTTGQWWFIENPWNSIAFGDPGAGDEFVFDGDWHFNVAWRTDYYFDTEDFTGVWNVYWSDYDEGPSHTLIYEYYTGQWELLDHEHLESTYITAVDGASFVYNGECHEIEPNAYVLWDYYFDDSLYEWDFYYEWSATDLDGLFGPGPRDIGMDFPDSIGGYYYSTEGEAGVWYEDLFARGGEHYLPFDDVSWDFWLDIKDGSWVELGTSDYWFRFDHETGWLEYWYDNTATGYEYWFGYDVAEHQWYENVGGTWHAFGDASGSMVGFVYSPDGNSNYFYDGKVHAVGDGIEGEILYTYDGTYGWWWTIGGDYTYCFDYDADRWWKSDDGGDTWYDLIDPGYDGYFMWSGHEQELPWHEVYDFQFDPSTNLGIYDQEYTDFRFDFVNGTWEYDPDGWYSFDYPEDGAYFIYDGLMYDLQDGVEYRFDESSTEGNWIFPGNLTVTYDYYDDLWHANDADFVPDSGGPLTDPSDVWGRIAAGEWFQLTSGDFIDSWFRVDTVDPGVYWYYQDGAGAGDEHYFWYGDYNGLNNQWWWKPDGYNGSSLWVPFGSYDEVREFVFDGRYHDYGDTDGYFHLEYDPTYGPVGYWDVSGTNNQFAYEYDTGQWWRSIDGGPWETMGSVDEYSWFIYDGDYYDLPTGFEYHYHVNENQGFWYQESSYWYFFYDIGYDGVEFAYDYNDGTWSIWEYPLYDRDEDTWASWADAYTQFGDAGLTSLLLDGNWHTYENGEQIMVDGINGMIYWDAGSGHSFSFDVADGQWYRENGSSWDAFGSRSETPYFLFDGDVHTDRSIYIDNISYQFDGTYGIWSVDGVDTWAYHYDTGEWWRYDADYDSGAGRWTMFGGEDQYSWFVFDGGWWYMNVGSGGDGLTASWKQYDYDLDLMHYQIWFYGYDDDGGFVNFAYDFDARQWSFYATDGSSYDVGPNHAAYNWTSFRQPLEVGGGYFYEFSYEHGEVLVNYYGDSYLRFDSLDNDWFEYDGDDYWYQVDDGFADFLIFTGIADYWINGVWDNDFTFDLWDGIDGSLMWSAELIDTWWLDVISEPWNDFQVLVTDDRPTAGGTYDSDSAYAASETLWIDASWTDLYDLVNNDLYWVYTIFGEIAFMGVDNDGNTDGIWLGSDWVDSGNYFADQGGYTYNDLFVQWGSYMGADAEIQFYAASVGTVGEDAWLTLLGIATDTGATIYASNDPFAVGGDYDLEWGSDGGSRTGDELVFDPSLLGSLLEHNDYVPGP